MGPRRRERRTPAPFQTPVGGRGQRADWPNPRLDLDPILVPVVGRVTDCHLFQLQRNQLEGLRMEPAGFDGSRQQGLPAQDPPLRWLDDGDLHRHQADRQKTRFTLSTERLRTLLRNPKCRQE